MFSSGIGIDHIGELGLKASKVGTAFRVVNVITEAQYILVEFIHILEGHFHGDAFALTGKENDIMDGLFGTVHVFYEANDAFRFMVGNLPPVLLFSYLQK